MIAKKSRWRVGTVDNYGGFRLVEPFDNRVVGGERFDLEPEEVIDHCIHRTSID